MKDFRVTQAKVLLPVQSVAPIRGFLPPSILLVGERLDKATQIVYNGIVAEEFVAQSPTRLVVRIPPSQVGRKLDQLKVVSDVSITRGSAEVVLGIERPLRIAEGIEKLVQSWLLLFLTTPGSDIFSPHSGGGGRALIGTTTDRNHRSAAADLALAVERTRTELVRLQSVTRVPPSEKLLNTVIESVQFDEDTTTLVAQVSIKNMLGETAEVSVR
jgi:hypothetical protein